VFDTRDIVFMRERECEPVTEQMAVFDPVRFRVESALEETGST